MRGSLLSSLIFTLSLSCLHHPIATSIRWPLVDPVAHNIQSWCSDTPNPTSCITAIQSSPRSDLKTTQEGVTLILVNDAKANVRSTTSFITDSLRSEQENDVREKLTDCLNAYNISRSDLNFDPSTLDSPQGRSDTIEALNMVDDEVTYDCGWQPLEHHPPVVQQLADRVRSFAESVEAASIILSSIDQ